MCNQCVLYFIHREKTFFLISWKKEIETGGGDEHHGKTKKGKEGGQEGKEGQEDNEAPPQKVILLLLDQRENPDSW